MDRADERSALQPGQRLHLLGGARTGVSQFDLPEWHVFALQPEGHVLAAVRRPWERKLQIKPQQPQQFGQDLESGPGDQAAVLGLEVRGVSGHPQGNAPAFARTTG